MSLKRRKIGETGEVEEEKNELWIENAIKHHHIQLFDYREFKNVTICGEGGFAEIKCVEWPCSERQVVIKKLKKYEVKKFVQEVNFYLNFYLFFFFLFIYLFIYLFIIIIINYKKKVFLH